MDTTPSTKAEARALFDSIFDVLESEWKRIANERAKHEHYGPCKECEELWDKMFKNLRLDVIDDLIRTLPKSLDAFEIEEW